MAAHKREGYGRFPNSLVKSGAWAKLDRRIMAVYGGLQGLLDRSMTYSDSKGTWRVAYGHPTVQGIARASGVRAADVSRITDLLEELGLIIKTPRTMNRKPRVRYILLPPDHPIYSRIGYSCEQIYKQAGKTWGLARKWGRSRTPHELPTRLQTHELPTRLHSTDIHSPKNPPPLPQTVRRPSFPRAAARLSRKTTTKGKVSDRLLVQLFTSLPPDTWEDHTVRLLADDHRLRDIEEAKQLASGVLPHLQWVNEGKGGPAGETAGVPPGREDSSDR